MVTITLNKKNFMKKMSKLYDAIQEDDELVLEIKWDNIESQEEKKAYKKAMKELENWEVIDSDDYLVKRWLCTK